MTDTDMEAMAAGCMPMADDPAQSKSASIADALSYLAEATKISENYLKQAEAATDQIKNLIAAFDQLQGERALAQYRLKNCIAAMEDALKRLEKGAPGWGVAKDVLRAAIQAAEK